MKKKTWMSWSSGKDSAWAFYKLRQDPAIDLAGIFCSVNSEFDRVAMHGVRRELLERQAESLGVPLEVIEIPFPCSDEEYDEAMGRFVDKAKNDGIECFAFGDLFLEDVRKYREDKLAGTGVEAVFPLWGIPTYELSKTMVTGGLKAVITCVDPKQAPEELIGKEYNEEFLNSLTDNIDPCGENGEFHSFVFDGPMFSEGINIVIGDIVERDCFIFADILYKSD